LHVTGTSDFSDTSLKARSKCGGREAANSLKIPLFRLLLRFGSTQGSAQCTSANKSELPLSSKVFSSSPHPYPLPEGEGERGSYFKKLSQNIVRRVRPRGILPEATRLPCPYPGFSSLQAVLFFYLVKFLVFNLCVSVVMI
jgi:hypothetical protein